MKPEKTLRAELAGAFRWAARLDLHEGVANHFSAALGKSTFLMNPAGRHFSRMRASGLLLLDAAKKKPPAGKGAPDPTAWCLHAYLHRHLGAGCVLHAHPKYASALSSLAGWKMRPADQNACRFYNRVSYDEKFGGMLLAEEEAARQAEALGANNILVMRGHGVLVRAESVGLAFDLLYYFERACRTQWLAMSSGRRLFLIPAKTAEKTARQWEEYPNPEAHFNELLAILDGEEPDYKK